MLLRPSLLNKWGSSSAGGSRNRFLRLKYQAAKSPDLLLHVRMTMSSQNDFSASGSSQYYCTFTSKVHKKSCKRVPQPEVRIFWGLLHGTVVNSNLTRLPSNVRHRSIWLWFEIICACNAHMKHVQAATTKPAPSIRIQQKKGQKFNE